jgi:hypothetical protein
MKIIRNNNNNLQLKYNQITGTVKALKAYKRSDWFGGFLSYLILNKRLESAKNLLAVLYQAAIRHSPLFLSYNRDTVKTVYKGYLNLYHITTVKFCGRVIKHTSMNRDFSLKTDYKNLVIDENHETLLIFKVIGQRSRSPGQIFRRGDMPHFALPLF